MISFNYYNDIHLIKAFDIFKRKLKAFKFISCYINNNVEKNISKYDLHNVYSPTLIHHKNYKSVELVHKTKISLGNRSVIHDE